jgi:hypothetical protein
MRGITRNAVLGCGLALCFAGFVAGCSKNEEQPASTPPAPVVAAPATGAAKSAGGMVAGTAALPAPPGIQTGNYAGGRK